MNAKQATKLKVGDVLFTHPHRDPTKDLHVEIRYGLICVFLNNHINPADGNKSLIKVQIDESGDFAVGYFYSDELTKIGEL